MKYNKKLLIVSIFLRIVYFNFAQIIEYTIFIILNQYKFNILIKINTETVSPYFAIISLLDTIGSLIVLDFLFMKVISKRTKK